MKQYMRMLAALLVALAPLGAIAAEFHAGEAISLASGERIADDVYLAGGSVTSAAKIQGDLILGGGTIVVSGEVMEDLAAGGGNVTVTSRIGGDARIGGGTVVVQGEIGGDAMIGGGQVTIGGAGIGGDAVIGGGTIHIDAPIAGDALLGGGEIYLNAPVNGNVKITADRVTLGKNAVIKGDIHYQAKTELVKEDGAVVQGKVEFTERPSREEKETLRNIRSAVIATWFIGKFLALLVAALVIGLVFKRYSNELTSRVRMNPLGHMGRGLVTIIVLPVVSVLLLVSMLGIPLGIFGILGVVALTLTAWIISPIVLGAAMYARITKQEVAVSWKTILLGVVVYSLLCVIPVIGWILQVLLFLMVIGAVVSLKTEIAKQWR